MQTIPANSAPLHLIGAGGLGSDILACFKDVFSITGCWDDHLPAGSLFSGIPVLGSIAELVSLKDPQRVIIAVGNPALRVKIADMVGKSVHVSPVIIHPDSRLYDRENITLGDGCIIFPGVYITTRVKIGRHSVIHIGTSLHHDVTVGDCSVLMPGVRITGNVVVGKSVFLGPGQTVSNGVHVRDGERIQKD